MHLRCGGIFNDSFITRLLLSDGERILKICQHLAKLWARVGCPVFLTDGVVSSNLSENLIIILQLSLWALTT